MARCATCKIKIHPSDRWCDHCFPAAVDRAQKRNPANREDAGPALPQQGGGR
jgi:hypothetical protein